LENCTITCNFKKKIESKETGWKNLCSIINRFKIFSYICSSILFKMSKAFDDMDGFLWEILAFAIYSKNVSETWPWRKQIRE